VFICATSASDHWYKIIAMIKIPLTIAILLLACITAVAQQPADSAARRFQAGLDAQKAGQYEQALREYATALQLDPKYYFAQFNSASCYAELQRWPEAIAAFQAAIPLRPNE